MWGKALAEGRVACWKRIICTKRITDVETSKPHVPGLGSWGKEVSALGVITSYGFRARPNRKVTGGI